VIPTSSTGDMCVVTISLHLGTGAIGDSSSPFVRLFADMSRRVCFVDATNVTSTLK
jgi:hypothetical protein